jgi:ubiquinone/menaquinone biosynthesis C-methylase UbiE
VRQQAVDVPEAFDEVAASYDLMVALNPGYHRHLRSAAAALIERLPVRGGAAQLIDLGCGSGASTRALVTALRPLRRPFRLIGADGSAGMLEQARSKIWPPGVRFEQRRAEDLSTARTDWGLTGAVDGIFAAYLFRNVPDRDKVLQACYELLAPGGALVVHEYSVADSRRAQLIWSVVCWSVVIPLSRLLARDTALYRYLWRSVLDFDAVPVFAERLAAAGFVDVEVRTVPGWQRGVLHTFRARRPPASGAEDELG